MILRNSYNFENYISTLNYFANNNFNVFITCDDDINTKEIEKIDNVTVLSKYKSIFDVSLLNMFVYQISDKIVGQSSGSIILASLMKKKVFCSRLFTSFYRFSGENKYFTTKI